MVFFGSLYVLSLCHLLCDSIAERHVSLDLDTLRFFRVIMCVLELLDYLKIKDFVFILALKLLSYVGFIRDV